MNAPDILHLLTLQIPVGQADRLAAWLGEAVDVAAVEHTRRGAASAWVEVAVPDATQARLIEAAARSAFPVEASRIQVQTPRDWVAACQAHFPVVEAGRRLRIVPAHLDPRPAPTAGRSDVVVQCGLSFGTGQHFTTRFCLDALDRLADREPGASVLDVGCGTGVLALAASALGFGPVAGTDLDPSAVAQATENAGLNPGIPPPSFLVHDLTAGPLPVRADIVVANLFSRLLVDYARRLDAAAGRWLLLTGIQEPETDDVLAAFLPLGWTVARAEGDAEWSGLVLRRGGR